MAQEQSKIRVVKACERDLTDSTKIVASEDKSCATMTSEDLRAYLIERRRAVMTELESLNRLLKIS